jgi:hypothetical protein
MIIGNCKWQLLQGFSLNGRLLTIAAPNVLVQVNQLHISKPDGRKYQPPVEIAKSVQSVVTIG